MLLKDAARGGRRGGFRKALLSTLIILAVALTLLEEGFIVAGFPWDPRKLLSWALAALDLLFTALAASALARSLNEGRFREYLREEAWIDLPSAILPLVFTTGPFLFETTIGIQATTTLVALGNFRLLRGLGLLRALRLFHFYRNSKSEHAAALALLATFSVFVAAEAASLAGFWPDSHEALAARREATLVALTARPGADNAETIARVDADLLLVRNAGTVVYTRYSSEEYRRRFAPDEIGYLRAAGGIEAFFSVEAELRAEAAAALVSSLSALAMLGALALGLRKPRAGESGRHAPQGGSEDAGDDSAGPGEPAGPAELKALLGEEGDAR